MAEAYYEPIPATDSTMAPVPGAVFQVFELADTAFTTPLSLRVGSGNPTTSVAASATLATLPGVYVTSSNFEHIWKSGEFQWRRDSITGAKLAVEASRVAAVQAAGLVGAPADDAMAAAAKSVASKFTEAMGETYALKGAPAGNAIAKWSASTVYGLGVQTVSPDGDVVTANVAHTSGATYDATKWNLPKNAWRRRDLVAGDDLNTLLGTANYGRYRSQSTSIANLPGAFLGHLEVLPNATDGRTIQIFTRSNGGLVEQYSRAYSASTWGAWANHGWRSGLVVGGVDFNAIRNPGAYAIQFSNHPNQPAANVGTLEVLPSSGLLLQRFTTWEIEERTFKRRSTSSTDWSAWTLEPTRAEFTGIDGRVATLESAGAGASAPSIPKRGALTAQPTTVTSKSAGQIIMSLSNDRLRGWNANGSAVSETRDDGATWIQLNDKDGANPFAGSTVESVRQLDNGELLISCQRGSTARRELWVTANLDTPTARTYTKTLDARAAYIKFTSSWSQDDHGPLVIVNEYGPKTPTWVGEPVAAGENARYTYLSTDYGKTWSTIFDLNDYLTNVQGRLSLDNQHLHGAAIDPYWDRLWVTFGDNSGGNGSNGIVYSDDLGATWETAHFYTGTTPPHQVVGIQPMPKCILFYGDMGPDVVRIDRSEGRYKAGGYATPTAFDSTATGMHLCQGFMRAKRVGDDAPALAAFSSEGATAPPFAVATLDGYTFMEVWRDTVDSPSGFGARSIVGPTARGRMIIASNDQKVAGMWSQVVTEAPGY